MMQYQYLLEFQISLSIYLSSALFICHHCFLKRKHILCIYIRNRMIIHYVIILSSSGSCTPCIPDIVVLLVFSCVFHPSHVHSACPRRTFGFGTSPGPRAHDCHHQCSKAGTGKTTWTTGNDSVRIPSWSWQVKLGVGQIWLCDKHCALPSICLISFLIVC